MLLSDASFKAALSQTENDPNRKPAPRLIAEVGLLPWLPFPPGSVPSTPQTSKWSWPAVFITFL